MMWSRSMVALVAILALAPAAVGQVSIGGAQSLYIQPGARPAGMGDSFVAIADDATAVSWNPAGLAFIESQYNVALMHTQLVPDWDDVYYEYAAYAQRVEGLGTIGASVVYLTYGEQYATEEGDETGPTELGTFNSFEVIPSVAYGTAIGENLAVGLALKFVYVDLAPAEYTWNKEEGSGSTFAADVGVLYRMLERKLRLGGAIQHVGPRISYADEGKSDPLPRNLKLGASYVLLDDEMNEFTIAGEYNKSLVIVEDIADPTVGVILNVGAEYCYYDLLALRLGYVYDDDGDVKDLAYGMGLNYRNFAFDIANVPQAEGLKRPFRFSLTATF